ncbi:DUF1190 domain-containing protein [Rhodoblastus acidophilus]|uniref:DUF1190 domain-containing protein n=1 Tax=Candidatus Rhodoblastus alkanivorans TaxID=2954117 RepID=A0ABS9ZBE9_9HYPH|nr:DUF1190 domain-containing protein [Candidatus Rhodoblastus alkanivorans]MCI4677159.1 DUF1190 domain-containing protein [Candidatus Rhodoblastus alkanivorans]MCI4684512.1 DUF1190 domain-containing protein [Candidatus Rhodoblastus alkanivorans]
MPPAPVVTGQPYFFASRRACASSGAFSARQCAEAFDRVDDLMRERAPKFPDRVDCVLQFKLCEKESGSYRPQALGVEIDPAPRGLVATPMLAVETPAAMLHDPEPAPPASAPPPQGERSAAISPYGLLSLEPARFAPAPSPSLAGYHRFVEEVELRRAVFAQNAEANPGRPADR